MSFTKENVNAYVPVLQTSLGATLQQADKQKLDFSLRVALWGNAFHVLVQSSQWNRLSSLFSECCYARRFVGVLFEAVKYCFGSVLPV